MHSIRLHQFIHKTCSGGPIIVCDCDHIVFYNISTTDWWECLLRLVRCCCCDRRRCRWRKWWRLLVVMIIDRCCCRCRCSRCRSPSLCFQIAWIWPVQFSTAQIVLLTFDRHTPYVCENHFHSFINRWTVRMALSIIFCWISVYFHLTHSLIRSSNIYTELFCLS